MMPDDDTHAKLNKLRQDAAHALDSWWSLRDSLAIGSDEQIRSDTHQIRIAALYFLSAQAKYTLACLEAKQGPILPYVDVEDK